MTSHLGTSRVDEIVNRAYEDLERFYKNHGECKTGVDRLEKFDKERKERSLIQSLTLPGYDVEVKAEIDKTISEINEGAKKTFSVTDAVIIDDPIIEESVKKEPVVAEPKISEKDLEKMKGKDIIQLVKELKGIELQISLKSKKLIVSHAIKALNGSVIRDKKIVPKVEIKKPIIHKTADFNTMSSREIVKYVEEKTGVNIKICLKSKQNIIRHANKILSDSKAA